MDNHVLITDYLWFQEGPGVRNTQYTTDGVKLLNVANFVDGNIDLTTSSRYISDEEAYGKYKHFLVDEGDFLIASSGIQVDYFEKKMGFIRPEQLPLCMNTSTIRFKNLKPDELDMRYFMYYLKSNAFKNQLAKYIVGSAQLNFGPSHLKKMTFPVVEIKRQKYIVENLEKIYTLITLRKEQLAKLDQLVKSRFIEQFGDPVINPKGWPIKSLLDMGYCKNGMNFHTGDSGIEMHCLGVGDFKDLSVIDGTEQLPVVSLNEAPPEESMLRDGDIVFVRSNGNKALVGRCLVVYPRKTPTTYSGFCIRYRLTSNEVDTAYLLRVLKTDSMRKKMAGRGANIQNLNQQILASLDIPIPPMEMQKQFATFVDLTDKSKLAIQQSLDKLELLKKSLMQEYFG